MRKLALATVVCLLAGTASQVLALDMGWKALDVTADLDADGLLQVKERHHLVLTGARNGWERVFDLRKGQRIVLRAVTRIDPESGARTPLVDGDLDLRDHYAWIGSTLRWRSRLPSDPPFRQTELVYEIDYALRGVLEDSGGGAYVLAYDVGLPGRPWPIEQLTATVRIDPVWAVSGSREREVQAGPLPPGQGHAIRVPLRYTGTGQPAGTGLPPEETILLVALAVSALLLLIQLVTSEGMRGRFARIKPELAARSAWLHENVLRHPPEIVGTLWSRKVGACEVAALIARLTLEGKLQSSVGTANVLHLTLTRDREELGLADHERALVDGLFFDGDSTSTNQVSAYYRGQDFEPARLIRPALKARAALLMGPPVRSWWAWALTALAYACGSYLLFRDHDLMEPALALAIFGEIPLIAFGWIMAARWRQGIERAVPGLAGALLLAVVPLAFAFLVLTDRLGSGVRYEGKLGVVLVAVALFMAMLNGARSRDRGPGIAMRKRLASARRHFQDQLTRSRPALRDEWFPYVIAFGLDQAAESWAGARHPSTGDSGPSDWRSSETSSSPASSGDSRGWSGGGGAFGGAGASGSWAAAAGSLGAIGSASSGSSSDSDPGGSSSDSSSGGGGGGDW